LNETIQYRVNEAENKKAKEDEEKIGILTALGASKEHAKGALEVFNGDMKKASEFLMEQMEGAKRIEKRKKQQSRFSHRQPYGYDEEDEDEEDEVHGYNNRRKKMKEEKKEEPERKLDTCN